MNGHARIRLEHIVPIKRQYGQIESDYEAIEYDLRTLNQKIDEGLRKCFEDSDILVKSKYKDRP